MKRLMLLILTAVMLCSCSSKSSSSQTEYFSNERAIESSSDGADSSSAKKESSSQQEKKVWKVFDEVYPTLDDDSRSYKNYDINRTVWDESGLQGQLIESGQDTAPQNELCLGNYHFGYNGCEVIAGYNMLTLCGIDADMPKLITEFEHNILVAQDGSLGSDPRKMDMLLDRYGIGYTKLSTLYECDKALESGSDIIFAFYTGTPYFSEIHTICITGGEDKYVLNRYNTIDGRSQIESISDIADDEKQMITGYAVKTREVI